MTEFVALGHHSLDTFDRMEKRNGHIYNWYDTRTLKPIAPRVVSSVDSGNLAASFYTLRSGTEAMLLEPLLDAHMWSGIRDQLALLATLDALPAELPPVPEGDELRPWIDWCFAAQLSPAFDAGTRAGWPCLRTDGQDAHRGRVVAGRAAAPYRHCVRTGARLYAVARSASTMPLEPVLKDGGLLAIARGAPDIDDLDGRLQRAWTGKAVDERRCT